MTQLAPPTDPPCGAGWARRPVHRLQSPQIPRLGGVAALTRLELIFAVTVLGLLALWAVPRLSPGSPSPDPELLLRMRLRVLRVAIERYYQDHGHFPGAAGVAEEPVDSEAVVVRQLTQFSRTDGRASATRDAWHCLGPYLAEGIPPCPVGSPVDADRVHVVSSGTDPGHPTGGWIYDCATGDIRPAAR